MLLYKCFLFFFESCEGADLPSGSTRNCISGNGSQKINQISAMNGAEFAFGRHLLASPPNAKWS
jgi:hypothetical protein